jgi:hypothetical protein
VRRSALVLVAATAWLVGACASSPTLVTSPAVAATSPSPTTVTAPTSSPTASVGGSHGPLSSSPKPVVASQTHSPIPTVRIVETTPTPAATHAAKWPNGAIAAMDAWKHEHERKTVCGDVVSPYNAGSATFLNLDVPYPGNVFTIVIWPEDRYRYPQPPEVLFADRTVCVSGVIEPYGDHHQIQARRNIVFAIN